MQTIKIIIADDHPMVLEGLSSYFSNSEIIEVVATTSQVTEIEHLLQIHSPDILIVDYHFANQKATGLDACKQLVNKYPTTKVIVVSSFSDISLINQFIDAGACGYLLKTSTQQEYIEAIQTVYAGVNYLSTEVRDLIVKEKFHRESNSIKFTKTEKEILKLIIQGASTHEIAKKLFRETSTIDSHRKSLLAKLQLLDSDISTPSKNIMYYVAKLNLVGRVDWL